MRRMFGSVDPARLGLLLLAVLAVLVLGNGIFLSWSGQVRGDMYQRLQEYQVFSQGVFPHARLAATTEIPGFRSTVYPPYALPMFAPFFAWGGALQGRIVIHLASGLSLLLIAWFGRREFRGFGTQPAILGALAPLAIAGNSSAFAEPQFSILCMGLVTSQFLLLERGRVLPAGLCWALAMIKPQIALCYALAFLTPRRSPGLVLGLALLTGLTLAALGVTGVTPQAYGSIWTGSGSISFVKEGSMTLIGLLADRLQVNPSLLQVLLGVCGAVLLFLWWQFRGRWCDSLQVLGVCSAVGAVAFYHRPYDNIMLFPILLGVLGQTFRASSLNRGREALFWGLVSIAMAMALWLPMRLRDDLPLLNVLQLVLTVVAGLALALRPAGL